MPPQDTSPDFEQSLKRLEDLVQRMEGGEQTLDAALRDFEQGIALIRDCREGLDRAEQRVTVLLQQSDGEAPLEPLVEPLAEHPGSERATTDD